MTTTAQYQQMAIDAANTYGVNSAVFVAQIQAESGFNPNARSSAGALGIAQFMPATAAGMGVNPWDPQSALQGAARYDAASLRTYGGDYQKMLAAYNAGGGAVNAAVANYGTDWLNHMPTETQSYVRTILSNGNPSQTTTPDSASSSNPLSGVQSFLSAIKPALDWLSNPTRVLKMAAGLAIVGVALFLLIAPDALNEVSKVSGIEVSNGGSNATA